MAPKPDKDFELPEWRQEIFGETLILETILGKPFKDQFTQLEKLLTLDPELALIYMPLILAHLVEKAASVDDPERFEVACEFVKCVLTRYRPTKLRFLLLTQLGKHKRLWNIDLVFRSDAYEVNERHAKQLHQQLMEKVNEGPNASTASTGSTYELMEGVTAEELLKNDDMLRKWVEMVFLHPKIGVERKDNLVGLRKIPQSFTENDAFLYIVEKLQVRAETASALGERMVLLNLITCVSKFPKNKTFGFGKNYYKSYLALSQEAGEANIVRTGSLAKEERDGVDNNNLDAVKITTTVFVDMKDMQSLFFWRDTIWQKPLQEKTDFGWVETLHPFRAITDADMENVDASSETAALLESCDNAGISGSRAYVNKVFSSIAKPGIVSLQVAPEESRVEFHPRGEKGEAKGVKDEQFKSLMPQVLVKEGDNLFQDSCVEIMFRIFNYIWRIDRERFPDSQKVPFSYAYDVLPTGKFQGLMEVLTNVQPLNHYDWAQWAKTHGKKPEVLDLMLRSAAGSYVAAYVLGARDRHWDNIMIKDSSMLLQIDFGFVLGSAPPIDAPRFSISPDMEEAFKEVGIWEDFVTLCGKSYISLKYQAPAIAREVYALFRHTGLSFAKCMDYLGQKDSFNKEATFEESEKYICDQVRSASADWKTHMRAFCHDHVDPAFYKMLKAKFPPALLAEVIVQHKQQKKMGNLGDSEKQEGELGDAETEEQGHFGSAFKEEWHKMLQALHLEKKPEDK